ncbi:hypothetical protein BX600DRAFT_442264 [Xylariales sp. PMI_506]|nr:hypothetical protein BX600DRAFT_442264 [Xylariales sp. PMI_506]
MGGNVFGKGAHALYTPRMPPAVYRYIRDACHAALQRMFVVVATPIEGPEKTSYGDIDIVTTWQRKDVFPSAAESLSTESKVKCPFEAVYEVLGAVRMQREGKSVANFAIPWPGDLPKELDDYSPPTDSPRFIQVDLHICDDLETLEWILFKHAHGDLWNILGSTIRPYGLTVDEVGLHIRIPEIEQLDRKKAKILLSKDPCEILNFLGLRYSGQEWESKFETAEAIYEYATTCRFFWVKCDLDEGAKTNDYKEDAESVGGEYGKEKLKSNDRKRMAMRPLFRNWINDFLPRCQARGKFTQQSITQDQVREEAFQHFGVQNDYETRLLEFCRQRQRDLLWKAVIKPTIPEDLDPQWRGCVASALKKIILQDDSSFGYRAPIHLKDENGVFIEDEVKKFVQASWKGIGEVAWKQSQTKYHQHLANKAEKQPTCKEKK